MLEKVITEHLRPDRMTTFTTDQDLVGGIIVEEITSLLTYGWHVAAIL